MNVEEGIVFGCLCETENGVVAGSSFTSNPLNLPSESYAKNIGAIPERYQLEWNAY